MDQHITTFFLASLSLAVVGLLILLGQYLWAKKYLRGEYSRKFIHMLSALWIASWRFFLPFEAVVMMAITMMAGVIVTKRLKILRSVYSVRRPTNGELSYGLGIALTALLFREPAVYALAIVNLGIADGLAAIIGKKFGKRRYRVLGARKTFIGTAACFLFAIFSGALFWKLATVDPSFSREYAIGHIMLSSLLIAAAELFGQKGLDNVMIPLITGIAFMGVV